MAHQVVIVGGGFAGLYAARSLRDAKVQVTLVDRRNFHVFQPLLYQVATAGLSPGDIAYPLRWVLRKQENARVILGAATGIDPERRVLLLADGEVPYDTLIVAAGATHSYFGHAEWERVAPGLKSVEDATEIRSRIFYAFEAAERAATQEERLAWLTFVLVGAGPTGVELAGTLCEIATDTLRGNFRSFRPEESRVLLLEGGNRILSTYPEELSLAAERQLVSLGVRPMLGARVTGVDSTGVTYEKNGNTERIAARTVLWAAGVRGASFGLAVASKTGVAPDRAGRIPVNPDLTIPGHPEILVLGDLASVTSDGKPVPGVAPAAIQMGQYAAKLIKARLEGRSVENFRYRNKGSLATIGRHAAIADFGKIRISGLLAWLAWLFIHLMFLVGFQNRLLVLTQWAFHYFTYNRGARLITAKVGPAADTASAPGPSKVL